MKIHATIFSRALIVLCIVLSSLSSDAHGPRYTHLATSAEIAEDIHSNWSAEDVANGIYDSCFTLIETPEPNLNFTTSTFWVRFKVSNGTKRTNDYLIETGRPLTNTINLYRFGEAGLSLLFETGDDLPFESRPVVYRKFAFPITLAPKDSMELLLQLKSDGEVINLPIKLWEADNFNGFVQRENLTLGFYYGLLLFVVGLFLFFSVVAGQRIYAYYTAYVAFLLFMQASLDGLAFEYLWPHSPWMANHSILFFSGASVFTIMLYAAEFLNISEMPNWYHSVYRFLQSVVFICILTGLMSGFIYEITFPVVNAMSLISLLWIILGIELKRRYQRTINWFFAIGFLSVLAGGIVFIMTNFNLIYSEFLSANAIKLGSAAEVTFLSLAMVGRYRSIQLEKEAAQKEAFENLEQLNKLTREQNVILEKEVQERTAEINEKSIQLEEKNQEIIDSITYARRIQEAILPPDNQLSTLLPNAFVLYLPKDIVAGDFYWLEETDDEILIAAADCTGHGVPGAMVSVVCHNALNRSVREFDLKIASKILDRTALIVDETFEKSEEEVKDGMDISLLSIPKSGEGFGWAGANNPVWVVSKHDNPGFGSPVLEEDGYKLFEIKADKQPIGRYPNRVDYSEHQLSPNKGDMIYLFSDGFPDQFGGPKGKKYKYKTFKRFLISISDKTESEQKSLLEAEFNAWKGSTEQVDDVCVIGIRV